MRAIGRWAHLMSTSVSVAPFTGRDGYGKPTYGTAVTYKAHISRKRELVRSAGGQQVESGQAVHLNTNAAIQPTALLTLSTGDVGSTEAAQTSPTIVAVARLSDQRGPHHTVLYL
jgi:hypothetical protein